MEDYDLGASFLLSPVPTAAAASVLGVASSHSAALQCSSVVSLTIATCIVDKAHLPSIRNVIWILSSDTIWPPHTLQLCSALVRFSSTMHCNVYCRKGTSPQYQ